MFLDIARARRSIRKYKSRKIEPNKVNRLIEAALRSPSSRGINPWQFVVVEDEDMLEALSRAKASGAAFVKDAPLAIVVCAETNMSDVWVEDASIASAFLLLCAQSLGLGACWIQIRNRKRSDGSDSSTYVAGLLGMPEGTAVESMIAVGYPDETKPPLLFEELSHDRAFRENYGDSFAGRDK